MNTGVEAEALEPGILNSNLFPVKANGEVLFLSDKSFAILGIRTPISIVSLISAVSKKEAFPIFSNNSCNCSPKNIDITAGGASCPPSLWSFPGVAVQALKTSAYLSIPSITAIV